MMRRGCCDALPGGLILRIFTGLGKNNDFVTPAHRVASRARRTTPVETPQGLTMTNPLAACLLPSTLVFTRVLAAGLIGAFGTGSALSGEAEMPEQLSVAAMIGAPAQPMRAAAASPAPVPQASFAFGFLEFDWDPNAPGGVPGFDPWPKHELRVGDASARSSSFTR